MKINFIAASQDIDKVEEIIGLLKITSTRGAAKQTSLSGR
jgi:hypothetical protein